MGNTHSEFDSINATVEVNTPLLKIGGVDKTSALSATTGTNTGDNATNTQYSGLASSKQDTLVSGTNIKTLNSTSLLGSGDIALVKGDVGLGNVDNTSDANKPVSTAQQTAIDAKVENNLTASTTVAPSKDAVNTGLGLKVPFQLIENTSILLPSTLSADGKYSGSESESGTLGEICAISNTLYLASDGKWYKTDQTDEAKSGDVKIRFCALAGNANDPTILIKRGKIRGDSLFPTFSIGKPIYLSGTGLVSHVMPDTGVQRIVGYSNTADEMDIDIEKRYTVVVDKVVTMTASTSGTITLTENTLRFVKNGKKVDVTGFLTVASVSSPIGQLQIDGLQYAVANANKFYSSLSVAADLLSVTAVTSIVGYFTINNTRIIVQKFSAGSANALASDVVANSSFIICGSYFTS